MTIADRLNSVARAGAAILGVVAVACGPSYDNVAAQLRGCGYSVEGFNESYIIATGFGIEALLPKSQPNVAVTLGRQRAVRGGTLYGMSAENIGDNPSDRLMAALAYLNNGDPNNKMIREGGEYKVAEKIVPSGDLCGAAYASHQVQPSVQPAIPDNPSTGVVK